MLVRPEGPRSAWLTYAVAAALAVAGVALPLAWREHLGGRAVVSVGLATVALSAAFGGAGPGMLTTLIGAVLGMLLYTGPTGTFRVPTPGDLFTLGMYVVVGSVISLLCGALQRARGRSEAILRSVADAYYALDRRWRFTDVNDRAADAFGQPRERLVGRVIWEALPQYVGTEAERQLRRAMDDRESVRCETRSALDASRWIEMRACPSPEGVAVFVADVTERKANEHELRRQRDLTRAITDNAAESLFLLDGQGRVTFMNAAATATFGWREDELLGRSLHDVVHRHDDAPAPDAATGATPFPAADCPMLRVFANGRPLRSHEDVFFRRDGSSLHVACSNAPILDDQGRVTAAVLVAHDISQRVRIEQALRGSEARLAAIFNQAGVGIAQTDLDGRFQLVNRRYCELVGRSTREMLGMQITDITHGQDVPAQVELQGAMTSGDVDRVIEKRYVRPDGTVVWGHVSATLVRDADGRPHSLLGVVQDITSRKVAEAGLVDAKDAADAARETAESANRAKDRFLAVLSHELRTPLTPVLTAVQMMERDTSLPTDVRESLSMIRRNVELEARLIDDLLDLNRVSHGKLQLQFGSPDVHEKLRSVAQICDSDARAKGVQFTLKTAAPHRHVRGDGARLQQVFWNLIKNAIKFTPEGGRVEVSTRCEACGEDASERLVVTVADTGVGIEPDVLPRIFDAFVQGDGSINRTFGGMGLGLAITRALVEAHGGTIAAASDGPGQGATFTVTLPLVADAPDAASRPSANAPRAARASASVVAGEFAGARILLVEDDADSANILARLLRRSGAAVQTADSVAMGLQVALSDRHDLLISDIGLPDGSGLDLMRQLIAARREGTAGQGEAFPAIALSGFGMEEDVRRSREAGFAEHLTKPVNLDHLHDAIKRVLAGTPAPAVAGDERA